MEGRGMRCKFWLCWVCLGVCAERIKRVFILFSFLRFPFLLEGVQGEKGRIKVNRSTVMLGAGRLLRHIGNLLSSPFLSYLFFSFFLFSFFLFCPLECHTE